MNVPYLYVNFKYTNTCRDQVILLYRGWSPKPLFNSFIYFVNTPPLTDAHMQNSILSEVCFFACQTFKFLVWQDAQT